MLRLPYVPVHYAAHQGSYLLHNSEHFFPPLNAVCTLGNLVMTIFAYLYSRQSPIAAAKAPRLALATALSVATTAYALLIMVPMNRRQMALAVELEKLDMAGDTKAEVYKSNEMELRRIQVRWTKMNYGRAVIMLGAAVVGASALLVKA